MELGKRMKQYEFITRNHLICRTPVIIRIDGRAFHTFTKGLNTPYDTTFMDLMQMTTLELCKQIQGCKLGYTQSDEISLLLTDYDNIDTQSWFENNISKIISISASTATLEFNKLVNDLVKIVVEAKELSKYVIYCEDIPEKWENKGFKAMFDSRAFNLPKEEVCNYFIWRQQDATRNAIQMAGQSQFSHKGLQNKSCKDIQEMLLSEKEIDFNDYPTTFKRGTCIIKKEDYWTIDKEIPIFTQQRNYIEDLI